MHLSRGQTRRILLLCRSDISWLPQKLYILFFYHLYVQLILKSRFIIWTPVIVNQDATSNLSLSTYKQHKPTYFK